MTDEWNRFDRGPEGDRTLSSVERGLQMPLERAMMTERAVRKVLPDPVDDAIVLRCVELALRAPTGSNGQNWEFVIVKDRAAKERLKAQYERAWRLYGGLGRRALPAEGGDSMAKILDAVQWQVDHFAEIPVVVESSYYGSIYPSVQNLLLAARAMGLGASLITLPLWSTTIVRRILGLPISVQPCCAVPLGWPRGRYGPTTRKAVETVVHLDRYGNHPSPTTSS
jgi:nitroreductase